jgi:hypothetical protein
MKKQHAILTLIDTETGYDIKVTYQPSLKERQTSDNSPAVNAMIRICILLSRAKEQMGQPLEIVTKPKKPLTFWQKVGRFFSAGNQYGR